MRLPGSLLQDYLAHSAQQLPDKIALVCGKQRLSYAELARQSDALAHALLQAGLVRGDRVIVLADNSVASVLALWAVLKADAVVCPVSPHTRSDKLAYYLHDTGARALMADAPLADQHAPLLGQSHQLACVLVDGVATQPLPGLCSHAAALAALPPGFQPPGQNLDIDLAAILYTSGSTGEPKGVMLSHRNMLAATAAINHYLGNRQDDVILAALPLSFDYGLYQLILATAVGARVLLERSHAILPQLLARARREAVTAWPLVPSVLALLAEMPLDRVGLPHLRYLSSTGAALAPGHIATAQRLFPQAQLFAMYGLTECKRCSYLPPQDLPHKPDSVGLAIPGTELWLVDEADQKLGPGQVGQLVIRGATVMRGYWNKPEATARRLRPGPLPGEQVLYTGDLCRQDEAGYLYFVARMDEVIKSRGEKVAPREVELALLAQPGVREAAVIGVPDPVWGHAIKAYVLPASGALLDVDSLLAACRRQLEPSHVPQYLSLVEQLPRTSSGKVDKTALSVADSQ
ncbi:AMP-dependent ligase [Chitinimonas prasina]|uniref:AMP-dependent ligase n=1 Tax=Chitinimonas prasina TaxID=1434937 RepID=A0ABQ5YD96_9NEIS|nr:class I adenylate-forming enzyme family protein [Chitinimonas prasina]GLR12448.1 AMP-dependent ligase [Chitinimonas prasina]